MKFIRRIVHTYTLRLSKDAGTENTTKKWLTNKTSGQEMGRRRYDKILHEGEIDMNFIYMAWMVTRLPCRPQEGA